MIEHIIIDPAETNRIESVTDLLFGETTHFTTAASDLKPGWLNTFLTSASRENLTFGVIEKINEVIARDGVGEQLDPNFNVYTYMQAVFDEETLAEFHDEIQSGAFDGMLSGFQVEVRAEELRRRKANMEIVEQGSGTAMFFGALFGAITDPVSYTPVGFLAKARTLGRVGRIAIGSATQAGVSEAGLQGIQDYRTLTESFLNIGFAGVLGGGIGAFSRLLNPKHPAAAGNVVFDPKTGDPIAIRTVDGETDVIAQPGAGGSVGAMKVDIPSPARGQRVLKGLFAGRITRKLQRLVTPVGRGVHSLSPRWRGEFVKFTDTGGIITDAMGVGIAVRSSEDIKYAFLGRTLDVVMGFVETEVRRLNIALGQGKLSLTFEVRNRAPDEKIMEIVQRKLVRTMTDEDLAVLKTKYPGKAWELIDAATDKMVAQVHKANQHNSDLLVKHGIMRNEKLEAELEGNVTQLEAELKAATAMAGASRKANSELAQGDLKSQLDLDSQLKEVRGLLSNERLKEKSLGEEYALAQMYNAVAIRNNPNDFKLWLRDIIKDKPNDEFLDRLSISRKQFDELGVEPVTINGQDLTVEQGVKLRQDVVAEWQGSEQVIRLEQAENTLLARQREVDVGKGDLMALEGDLARVSQEVDQTIAALSKDRRSRYEQRITTARGKRDTLARAVKEEEATLKAAETEGTVRRSDTPEAVSGGKVEAENTKLAALTRALNGLKKGDTKGRTTAKRQINNLKARLKRLNASEPAPKVRKETTQRQKGGDTARLGAARNELSRAESTLTRMETRSEAIEVRLLEHERNLVELKAAKVEAKKARTVGAKAERKARAKQTTAIKGVRGIQLRGEGDMPNLEAMVNEITANISDHQTLPHGILDQIVPDSARFKARRIDMTPEQRRSGEDGGWVRKDLGNILFAQYDSVASHMGYRLGLGIGEHAGARFKTWAKYKEWILQDIADQKALINSATNIKPRKKKQMLVALDGERTIINRDMDGLKDRLLGTEFKGDPDSWVPWVSAKVRKANFIRLGAGFLLPSTNDIGSVSLINGPLGKLLKNHMAEALESMSKLQPEDMSGFRMLLYSIEQGPHMNRHTKLLGADDLNTQRGRGPVGSRRRAVSTAVDNAAEKLTNLVSRYSGLRYWNRAWKTMTGLNYAAIMNDKLPRYASLSKLEIRDLANLGIDANGAARISKQLKKHAVTDAETGRFEPNFEKWAGEAGQEAEMDFRTIIRRAQMRAVFTPGIGDTPLAMSYEAGKLVFQFQTFAFTFQNRFMTPVSQKFVNGQHAEALAAYGHLLWASAMIFVGKAFLRGEPIEDIKESFTNPEKWPSTAYDMLDRSGYLVYLSPYIDGIIKSTGDIQEAVFGGKIGPGTRFQALNAWQAFLGPGFGLARDTNALLQELLAGSDGAKIAKRVQRIAPFGFQWKLIQSTAERF